MREKIEVEILWTLKSSPSHVLSTLDMVEKNNRLEINDDLKEKLRFLAEEKIIDTRVIQGRGIHYLITKKGNDLIWNGSTWQQIFNLINLIHPEKYTGKEIVRIIKKPEEEVWKGIEYLRNVRKYIDAFDENNERYWILSEKGEEHSIDKNTKNLDENINPEKEYQNGKSIHTHISQNPKSYWNEHKPMILLSIFITIGGGLLVGGFFYYLALYDEESDISKPEIQVTDLNALGGIVEGNKLYYSYEPTSLTPNGTKDEIFTLKISNTGKANADDFWIDMYSEPQGLWFDFQTSATIQDGNSIPCQQKKSYCTIGLVPKESSNMFVEYKVQFNHKLYQEIADENPRLFFNYGFDEGQEQTIEIILKFD
ncbi:hypothetical protein [Nitrosopumilus sp.]|uniref:hypothetical protein n=1 Tax=Nitrosopumilus sp. TaxID=2024843 RepID=UPI00247C8BEA|nr:hypothetical protein [Nitrosopumilus sp.]MCV0430467.1 hypothetical protein [Nitrosopumilus sp.]